MPRLAISNLAWTGNDDVILTRLAELGVEGVEIAPSKVAPWDQLNESKMKEFRRTVASYGLEISSFQAFFFGFPSFQLLGNQTSYRALSDHMERVCQLASVAGAEILVFGAPKNRLLLGHTMEASRRLAVDRLSELGIIAKKYGVCIGLEAVPIAYGGEFITSYRESLGLVREVDSPGLVFHLDAACTWLQGDDIKLAIQEAADEIAHFHISQPNLLNFSDAADYHSIAAKNLAKVGYDKWLCIEMLQSENTLQSVTDALNYVRKVYF